MGRAKLKLELIENDKIRNATYHKRKQGILKKANEFTILCAIDTAVIIYPPNSSDPPEIWPENPKKVKKMIDSYYKSDIGGPGGRKTCNLTDLLEERKKKMEEEVVKARNKNLELKYPTWFDEFEGLSVPELRELGMALEQKENWVRQYLEMKKQSLVQLLNQGCGWFGDYPVFDGGFGYGNPSQWGVQPTVVRGGLMPKFGEEEDELKVINGYGDYETSALFRNEL